jgi:hypothetical protein
MVNSSLKTKALKKLFGLLALIGDCMMSLLEMMLKSQNGEGISRFASRFGLDTEQTEKALEAVLPAFSTGLKRNTARPVDVGAFLQTLSGGHHAKYVDDTRNAFSDDGVRDGNGILKHLFGSKNISRAVAKQASLVSGVGEDVIKKMLPAMASMVMGGLFKQSTGENENNGGMQASNISAGNSGGGGILGQILGELVKGGLGDQNTGQRRGRSNNGRRKNNPLGDMLEQMMGGSDPSAERSRGSRADNPLGEIFENMLNQKRGGYEPAEEPRQDRRRSRPDEEFSDHDEDTEEPGSYERTAPESRRPSRKGGGGLEDLFGDMFETGHKVDEEYQGGIDSIFDKFRNR